LDWVDKKLLRENEALGIGIKCYGKIREPYLGPKDMEKYKARRWYLNHEASRPSFFGTGGDESIYEERRTGDMG